MWITAPEYRCSMAEGLIPTAENLALTFWERLRPGFRGAAAVSPRMGHDKKLG